MCDACRERGRKAKDAHYSVEDFEDEPRYRKAKKRNRKVCAKSKTNEPCSFTVPVIKWSYFSKWDERWHYTKVWTCERCGKHGGYNFGSTPFQI